MSGSLLKCVSENSCPETGEVQAGDPNQLEERLASFNW